MDLPSIKYTDSCLVLLSQLTYLAEREVRLAVEDGRVVRPVHRLVVPGGKLAKHGYNLCLESIRSSSKAFHIQ